MPRPAAYPAADEMTPSMPLAPLLAVTGRANRRHEDVSALGPGESRDTGEGVDVANGHRVARNNPIESGKPSLTATATPISESPSFAVISLSATAASLVTAGADGDGAFNGDARCFAPARIRTRSAVNAVFKNLRRVADRRLHAHAVQCACPTDSVSVQRRSTPRRGRWRSPPRTTQSPT